MYCFNSRGRRSKLMTAVVSGLFVLLSSGAAVAQDETEELMDLSLEELLGLEVTTFSRTPQLLSTTPAAMFVITQNDIKRSGARTVPDVLRMVPGVQVAQVDSSTWAVTARGSNGVFANKLLVLQDGRSIYNPLYSGVYWDMNDTDLNSIDRIEVIRGPGATMWGSNAVNGVINIITKKTDPEMGTSADLVAGTERMEGTLAASGQVGDAGVRLYGKYFDREGFQDSGADDWDMLRGGARIDWSYDDSSSLMLIGEYFKGDIGESTNTPTLAPPYLIPVDEMRDVTGGFALLAWDKKLSDTSGFRLQTYYDHTNIRTVAPEEMRDTFDIDWQHNFKLGNRNSIVWGLGYRISDDDTVGDNVITLDPANRTQRIATAFLQDEIEVVSDELFLLVGTKVSKNNFSVNDLEWEPNVRLSWRASEQHMLWSSVARAVRIPSRVEQDGFINGAVLPPGSVLPDQPVLLTISGTPNLETEEVTAYELGYRGNFGSDVETDLSFFYNQYTNIRTLIDGFPQCRASGAPPSFIPPSCPPTDTFVEAPIFINNSADVDSYGAEANIAWQASAALYLQAAYTYLYVDDTNLDARTRTAGEAPHHQFSARSLWNVTDTIDLDLWLRYVGELERQDIPAYLTLDARLAWTLTEQIELGLVGRNLLEEGHEEFVDGFSAGNAVEIPRELYAELRLSF